MKKIFGFRKTRSSFWKRGKNKLCWLIFRKSQNISNKIEYMVSYYNNLILLDSLLKDYNLLYVCCETGGFYWILINYSHITAIDSSATMIEAAEVMKAEQGFSRVDFRCCRFEEFANESPYDAISLSGTFGWYQPWSKSEGMLEKAHSMLRPGGLLVASYVPPVTLSHWLKAVCAPKRTVLLPRNRFLALAERAGFKPLLTMEHGTSAWALLQKPA